ncbi:MAG: hypothetical protein NVSMB49_26220 [Ktedonobacteraceae bacterium]
MAAKRRVSLAQQMKRLKKAEQSKWNKYTWSGLLLVLIGLVLISFGLSLHTGAYSSEGLALGTGALVILVGIIRVLIGVINPALPEDLIPYEEQEQRDAERGEENSLDNQLFERE